MTPTDTPHILLVNPWIHDFAAYDVWAKPLGLLILGGILRDHGARISYLDCLDRFHPSAPPARLPDGRCGRGPYLKTPIAKPPGLDDIPRTYSRYGIDPEWFARDLMALDPPDLVLVTSLMTYWYPGVRETIGVIKSVHPHATVVLGGIYASLCPEHAATVCGADRVVTGPGEAALLPLVAELTGWSPPARYDVNDIDALPRPVLDLERRIVHAPVLTSRGCPYHCAYCASHRLQPRMTRRSPQSVADEMVHWHRRHGVRDFAFYDDALLIDPEQHAMPLLERIVTAGMKVRLHTPNALHIREISGPLARLMRRAGFHTIRLGLETTVAAGRQRLDRKVSQAEFVRAVGHLRAAGFRAEQIGAYLLAGLPGQPLYAVEEAVGVVKRAGITPIIAHYTPIPHTVMWPAAVAASRYDLAADPLFTNNALMPCDRDGFSWPVLTRLKRLAQA